MQKDKLNNPAEYDYLPASSATEFTGLIPAGNADESDLEIYDEIFPFYEKIPRHTDTPL